MRQPARKTSVILACAAALSVGGLTAFAADWPQWRGPNRDGKVADFTPPQTWPKELARKWKVTVGSGVGTPALVGDKVYVFSRQGDEEIAQCLDAATGKPVWQDKYAATVTVGGSARDFPGPRSSPTVAEGKVVTLDEGATVSCLNAADGKVLWRKDFAKDMQSAWPGFNTALSPLIVDGMCVVHVGGRGQGTVYALDMTSGEPKWKWSGEGPAYASPSVMVVDGSRQIVQETERQVVGLAAADGKLLWQVPFGGGGRGPGGPGGGPGGPGGGRRGPGAGPGGGGPGGGGAAPGGAQPGGAPPGGAPGGNLQAPPGGGAGAAPGGAPGGAGGPGRGPGGPGGGRGGRGGGMGGGMSYNAASPMVDGQTVIVSAPSGTKAFKIEKSGDAFAAKEIWNNPQTGTQFNTPVLVEGRLYGVSNGGNLFCLDAATGKELWKAPESIGQRGFGTIVAAGPVLMALTPSSELRVFKPSDKAYEEVAKIKVADTPTHAYPVIAGNRVIIKDKDSVMMYAIE